MRAQQRLHAWAPGSAEPAVACGIAITHRIGFHAFAELVDATLADTAVDPFDLYTDPADVAPGLAAALYVLDQPSLDTAATAAWMLSRDGVHAPTRPVSRIVEHRYNPLLAAVQLAGVRDQLPPVDQLAFRTGHPTPRYPTITTPKTRRRLRLPEHHPNWPEPDPAWIPQTLWWNTIPAPLLGQPDRALRGSLLAMTLARTGTTSDWAEIASALGLPSGHAARIDAYLDSLRQVGVWREVLGGLDRLLTALQRHPPPIDYPTRRQAGNDLPLLTDAVDAGRRRHPTNADTTTLLRLFWERVTGGDIAYAPQPIRLDPGTAAYADLRRPIGVPFADLFHTAHRHLHRSNGVDGPLTWCPDQGAATV